MNRHRRGPSTHVLIAGDAHDLPVIRELAAALPDDAYGQILIETPLGSGSPAVTAPERVAIQWLPQAADCALPGQRLADALAGWAGEWLVDGDRALHSCHHLFIGAADCRPVEIVREVLVADACPHVELLADIIVRALPAPGVRS